MVNYSGKEVLIYGIAKSGISAANLLVSKGAKVAITDDKDMDELGEFICKLSGDVTLKTGLETEELLSGKELIVVSPSIPLNHRIIIEAKKKSVPIVSEVELASSMTEVPIIAVTGTNGKTTTTTLIHNILTGGGKRVFLGGNIGTPLSSGIKDDSSYDYLALEISSFQLEHIKRFRPHISVLLNITPDHLDRHTDINEYVGLKKRIFENQQGCDYCVLNIDDPIVAEMADTVNSKVFCFSRREKVNNGAYMRGSTIIIAVEGRDMPLGSIENLTLKGIHNIENFLAGSAAAYIAGIEVSAIYDGLKRFRGLPHRMEFVREIGGITFINDSKATNVGALYRSLEAIKWPAVLIAGGVDKGNDYSILCDLISDKVAAIVALGESKDTLIKEMGAEKNICASSISEAVSLAFQEAREGYTVILSPACASFDMFKDYKDRGTQFKEAVWGLSPISAKFLS